MAWMRMMGAESVAYHRETVLERGDDYPGMALAYYASRGETALRWGGAGAEELGLDGPVSSEAYEAIFGAGGARRPERRERLVTARRPGMELVISAHKSVSELGVIGRAEHMHQIMDAERDATLDYLDEVTRQVGGRRGRTATPTATGGLVYAPHPPRHFTGGRSATRIAMVPATFATWQARRAARTVRQTSGRLELRLAARRARLDPQARSFVEQVRAGLATGTIGRQVADQTDLGKLIVASSLADSSQRLGRPARGHHSTVPRHGSPTRSRSAMWLTGPTSCGRTDHRSTGQSLGGRRAVCRKGSP